MRVLLIEDDPGVMETLVDYLELSGLQPDCAYNGKQALERLREERFDVIVADIMMPGPDGISTVRQIREQQLSSAPVIFLTARDSLQDKTAAFGAGGDDYLVKPFALEELLLRIQALGRRGVLAANTTLQVGGLRYSSATDALDFDGTTLQLTSLQARILRLLMQRAPAPVTREELESDLWPNDEPPRDALRSHIYAIRKTLSAAGAGEMLLTLHGKGYRLVKD
ncbi:response regulator transcription factor [Granulosicoccaceae sp. 1_MG-2023]|nr:response regulator transcription factor [Granulosicoccaceae sp. 1_MG-2023]